MKKCQNMQSDILGLFPMKKEKELNALISTKTFHFYILIDEAPALLETLTPGACNNYSDDDNSNNYDDCDNNKVKKSK